MQLALEGSGHNCFLCPYRTQLNLMNRAILKVIVGAHAVMANGGVVAPVGLHMVALAAKRHAVPFVVLTGAHKVKLCLLRF